jgi:hypothetical protein
VIQSSGIGEGMIGAFRIAITVVLSPVVRSWYNRWGATDEEVQQSLPGDDLVPNSRLGYTRAVTVLAPAADVWPWLVQIGHGRGGLYSYDWLENLVGCDIHSSDQVVPEFQDLTVGDIIGLGPEGYPCFAVVAIEPGQTLVLQGADPKTRQPPQPTDSKTKGYVNASWAFFLDEQHDGTTRLIARQRLDYSRDMALIWRTAEPVNFVMERKMLLGLKTRAEAMACQS